MNLFLPLTWLAIARRFRTRVAVGGEVPHPGEMPEHAAEWNAAHSVGRG